MAVVWNMLADINLSTLLVLALAGFFICLEIGFRLGQRRLGKTDDREKSHTSALQGATLGLLALLLGFTFAMAVSRYDNRKAVVLEQANAIGTAELRGRLLPAAQAEPAAKLFREYVDCWLAFRAAETDIARIKAAEARASEIENALWNLAREATTTDPHSIPAGLFVSAMNDVIDMHEKRHRSIEDRVPEVVFYLLYLVSAFALGQIAYSSGLSGHRHPVANVLFACCIALVLVIIMDIDRPRRGLIQVSQESMLRLQESLKVPTAP
jgi:hypothetical protein